MNLRTDGRIVQREFAPRQSDRIRDMKESTRILIAQLHRLDSASPARTKEQKAEHLRSMRRICGWRELNQLIIRMGRVRNSLQELGCEFHN